MKKASVISYIVGGVTALLFLGLVLFVFCPAINIHNPGLWVLTALTIFTFLLVSHIVLGFQSVAHAIKNARIDKTNPLWRSTPRDWLGSFAAYFVPVGILMLMALIALLGQRIQDGGDKPQFTKCHAVLPLLVQRPQGRRPPLPRRLGSVRMAAYRYSLYCSTYIRKNKVIKTACHRFDWVAGCLIQVVSFSLLLTMAFA